MPLTSVYTVLWSLIGGRDVLAMSTKEAQDLVREFWIKVYANSLGNRDQKAIDCVAKRALNAAGLGYFVS